MLVSRSGSTFGMAGWSFCQRRIGRDCVQPFSMFFLQVSGCFCGAEEQLSNGTEVIASQWWDGLAFVFAELLFIFMSSFSAKQKPRVTDVHKLIFKWIQHTACDTEGIQVISNCSRIVHWKWEIHFSSSKALFYGYPLLSCLNAFSTHWGEKNASCWTDRAYFECQTYL